MRLTRGSPMTAPTLEKHDTWEDFLARTIIEKCTVELALLECTEFEKDDLKGRLSELYYHIECAESELGVESMEINW